METIKQIDIKNRTYLFYSDMMDIKTFDSELLQIDKRSYKDIGIYNIGYITIKKIEIKSYLKNKMMFSMDIQTKSKKKLVMNVTMKKII